MNWKEGDIAVCIKVGPLNPIDTKYPNLILNHEYVVSNIYKCPQCKSVALDVGLATSPGSAGTQCCTEYIPLKQIHWCGAERFKKKHLKSKEQRIEEAIKEENYELAEQLKQS